MKLIPTQVMKAPIGINTPVPDDYPQKSAACQQK
jgi:hypothetical protein